MLSVVPLRDPVKIGEMSAVTTTVSADGGELHPDRNVGRFAEPDDQVAEDGVTKAGRAPR